ncbi:long-chain acyl-CoA synthetase [Desulfocicer vacuolatum DSM 3385]|uniref:Long-chain acyl-CoA synthetase n=1 Tax=Desulfocicer vacuolatum DSM 3385 TaxID=1121400 RepID=A0A1W2CRL2_9BACT|nr:long-chain fatty acid--CoA ligase [Desulfocicer vacuolatum]SMC87298.1 long-chain acyl-CoA synthetase [Desulfocicer vacuolatum DSM 3385]
MNNKKLYGQKKWLDFYEPEVVETLNYKHLIMPEFLDNTVAEFPGNIALIFQGYKMTYAELHEAVGRFAAALKQLGIKKGDSVAILLPNVIPCVVAYHAALKLGAVVVMNNPLYSDRELTHQFNDSNSKVLITLDLLAHRMVKLRKKTTVQKIVYTSIGDYLPFAKRLLFPLVAKKRGLVADVKPAKDLFKFKDLLSRHEPDHTMADIGFEDTAMYQYTGGTTGVSKGVVLTHANLSCQVQQLEAWFPHFQRGKEVILGALPFFHVFGMSTSMNFAIYMGLGNILVPKPRPDALLETITRFKPTFAPLVPTMYIGILNHPDLARSDLTSLKGCFSGSAPLPMDVINQFQDCTGSIIVEGYGLTETTPVTHVNPFHGKRKPGSIGLPITDVECRIVDMEKGDIDLPPGESGELLIRGPQVMKEYLNRPDETRKVLTADGWLHTGDVARMDDEGYFYIVDRIKDVVLSGGYNVYPREIEEVLYRHPDVVDAGCVGIPHETRGESIKAFLVLKKGAHLTPKEVIDFCKGKLATYKLPVAVEIREELPKSTVGKILKKDLKRE